MPLSKEPVEAFDVLPDPGRAGTLDDLVERLRLLRIWAGNPSYRSIMERVNASWVAAGRAAGELAGKTTVVDCFRLGRRRLNSDLVIAIVHALHPDVGYVAQWRQALRVIGGETQAVAQVRVQDNLPQDLAGFTGRTGELDRLRDVLRDGETCAIEGMAGVGKTRLAVHIGHLLTRGNRFDRVLFVNLRGFYPDPTQPPADPAAVLDGFLRLMGVPGHTLPHDLRALAAMYRDRLGGTRTLVVLDNASSADQVRPLLPHTQGCRTLITSRRTLAGLTNVTHLAVDVFTLDEARRFLAQATPNVPGGPDPDAAARMAGRCGYLPLALGLVAGHIRGIPGWTLTDHADRLDERHQQRRLDTGVELALDLSYQDLPAGRQRLLRLLSLHPGQDVDAHAAAALAEVDLPTARAQLERLCGEHLVHQAGPGRYGFHDLVRTLAATRSGDEDPPPDRRAALTRLFDYYLATTAAAMDTLYPAEADFRPRIRAATTPVPEVTDPEIARAWLDIERPTLVAVANHTAVHDWPTHTTRLSTILYRHLIAGHRGEALAIHGYAADAAKRTDDMAGEVDAVTNLAIVHMRLGEYRQAADHLERALTLCRRTGDMFAQARVLINLGNVEHRLGQYQSALGHGKQALDVYRGIGDRTGQAAALIVFGVVEERLGQYRSAADHHEQALALCRELGNRDGEAHALMNLGEVEVRLARYEAASDHLNAALARCRELGHRDGEAEALNGLGVLDRHRDRPARSTELHRQALDIFRDIGDRAGEVWALNGLGETAHTAGCAADALVHHTGAGTIAVEIGDRDQQARAHAGLGRAHHALGDLARAREHYERALALYVDLGMPDADEVRGHVGDLH
jgi:tetratricopeptide (TPR) repeat protein